jgi:hypothetical protein
LMFPDPIPALVIRYSYLWHSEFAAGREEGVKDRPCAIVAAVKRGDSGRWRVVVLPVTHSPPKDPAEAIEIPLETKRRLGLDHERSWIVVAEWNEFSWPGPDVRTAPSGDEGTIAYGYLPEKFFARVQAAFAARVKADRAQRVTRTE